MNGWYVLVIISDVLAIVGSILKMEIQAKVLVIKVQIVKLWHIFYFSQKVVNSVGLGLLVLVSAHIIE